MDHRTFVSALVFLGKRGCWWIDLPPSFGKYKSIHARFTNWSRREVVLAFFNAVRDAKDLSLLRFVDASFVKCSIACLTGRGAGPQELTGKTILFSGLLRERLLESSYSPGCLSFLGVPPRKWIWTGHIALLV